MFLGLGDRRRPVGRHLRGQSRLLFEFLVGSGELAVDGFPVLGLFFDLGVEVRVGALDRKQFLAGGCSFGGEFGHLGLPGFGGSEILACGCEFRGQSGQLLRLVR